MSNIAEKIYREVSQLPEQFRHGRTVDDVQPMTWDEIAAGRVYSTR